MKTWLYKFWRGNKSFLLFVVLMCVFRSAFADWNTVPTGSMKPTILEGDRILVNKMAYDIRLPFTHISMYRIADPARGDIIIFDSKVSDKKLVKRVVGVPGDVVEMQDNTMYINGEKLSYLKVSSDGTTEYRVENLLGIEHKVMVTKTGSSLSSFLAVTIPSGFYLALGDNRDHSADSRVIGLVPRSEIVGRSRSVVMSLNYDNYFIPRSDRFFHVL